MADLKVSDVTRAQRLLERLLPKADLNKDGAIRAGDVDRIRAQPGVSGAPSADTDPNTYQLASTLDTFRRAASGRGGPSLENIKEMLATSADRLRAWDKDGDGKIAPSERRAAAGAADRALLVFAEACKGLGVRDFNLPAAREWTPPPFRWSGPVATVAQSLLDHCSKPGNDNKWPSWGVSDDQPRASRYVLDKAEAEAMVEALKPLYVSRRKAVLTEVARRTESSTYGCVSPTASGKRVLEAYARELGLQLEFNQPRAPSVPL